MDTTKHDNAESRRARAEAVAWMARLQAPDRSRELEAGLREWLAKSPANAAEFEKATDLWEELGGVSAAAVLKHRPDTSRPVVTHRRGWLMAGAAACTAALIAAVGMVALDHPESELSTRVGEHRTVTLSDGSRMALNTDTKVVVESWRDIREVRLERGEAYFEVAKDPKKPFVVIAGRKKVVAIGTAFVVRLEPGLQEKVSVVLVEGRVAVSDVVEPAMEGNSAPRPALLAPGERLVASRSDASIALDRPRIEAVIAWRRGEIVLDNTRLADAILELNRYSAIRLAVPDERIAGLPVSGIFRTGDSESFATAVSSLYDLAVSRQADTIVFSAGTRTQ
jgi:transmembrane sensor